MTSNEVRSAIGKPELLKMQQMAEGLQVGVVLGDRLLVEPVQPRTLGSKLESEGLLYMPEKAKEENAPRPSTGIVLKVGNLCYKDGQWAKLCEGAMILFNPYAPMSFTVDKKQYLIVDVKDVACTLEAIEGKELGELVQSIPERNEADVPVMNGRSLLG